MSNAIDLVARLEAASGPDAELNTDICDAVGIRLGTLLHAPLFTESIDAARTLIPASTETVQIGATVWFLPNGRGAARLWSRIKDDAAEGGWAAGSVRGNPGLPTNSGATPAIALCIASLRARE